MPGGEATGYAMEAAQGESFGDGLWRRRRPGDLADIEEKVLAGRRLDRRDGLRLMTEPDLLAVGRLADLARRRHGDEVYFVNNAHINYTNVCVLSCRFCGFARRAGRDGAYTMTLKEIEERAARFAALGARELHLVGGLHPDLPLSFYEEMLARLRARLPGVHLKAFTAVEVDHFARLAGLSVEEVLVRLRAAGLASLPGGGAEIFAPRARRILCRPKIAGARWLEVHRAAHRLGIPSNATMLYGHVETAEERVDHLLALRELQDETGGFLCFVPLAYHPENTRLPGVPGPTGWDDLRVMAVARLLLDNFRYVKAYWVTLTPKIAQLALLFGANDLDGTVREERIYHAVGTSSPMEQDVAELVRLIGQVGRVPVERDGLYGVVRRWDAGGGAA